MPPIQVGNGYIGVDFKRVEIVRQTSIIAELVDDGERVVQRKSRDTQSERARL